VWFFLFVCFETGSCCRAQAVLKLAILLPQPPKCWYYRHVLPHLASHTNFNSLSSIWFCGLQSVTIIIFSWCLNCPRSGFWESLQTRLSVLSMFLWFFDLFQTFFGTSCFRLTLDHLCPNL
jgi:hypothetical protein